MNSKLPKSDIYHLCFSINKESASGTGDVSTAAVESASGSGDASAAAVELTSEMGCLNSGSGVSKWN